MISDDHILFYFAGLVLVTPALIGVAYSVLKSLEVEHALIFAIVGAPLFIWVTVWIYSLVDDIDGHLS